MRYRKLYSIIFIILVPVVGTYLAFSLFVGTFLNPARFVKFGTIIARATILHSPQGGVGALNLARQVIKEEDINILYLHASKIGSSYQYSVPLPKDVLLHKKDDSDTTYLMFGSDAELNNYFQEDLVKHGWTLNEQLGSMYLFEGNFDNHMARLQIMKHYYLTNRIIELNYSITEN